MLRFSRCLNVLVILILVIPLPGLLVSAKPAVPISQTTYFPMVASNMSAFNHLAAGANHTCALTPTGVLKCWGSNNHGQLGDGTTQDRIVPVVVSALTGPIDSVTAGGDHTCVLTRAGAVKCWGDNTAGQLGDGTKTDRWTPVDVSGLSSGVSFIAAGQNHTCAVVLSQAQCWGANESGQLGASATPPRLAPAPVAGLPAGISTISAGLDDTCALTQNGTVWCWGGNAHGQLGNGTRDGSPAPGPVTGLSEKVFQITSGAGHNCAITYDNQVACWGWNDQGQLGDGSNIDRLVPVSTSDHAIDLDAYAITAGGHHTCVSEIYWGVLECWGDNRSGQLGDGTTIQHPVPWAIYTYLWADSITAGADYTCMMKKSGDIHCWGDNHFYQLGLVIPDLSAVPVDIKGLASGVVGVYPGSSTSCAILTGGAAKCWGLNPGDGSALNSVSIAPVDVTGLSSGVTSISIGLSVTCAVTTGGGVSCWGQNSSGELGDGTTTDSPSPVSVIGLATGMKAVAAGNIHVCVLTTAGGVKCWGDNTVGQLGIGSTDLSPHPFPADVPDLSSGVKAISAGNAHTCALTTAGGVKCWGANLYGELGDTTSTDRSAPVDVSGLTTGVVAIAAKDLHTCALTASGQVKCWGFNASGEIFYGGPQIITTPFVIPGLPSGITAISTGDLHTCLLVNGGGVKCWGGNTAGELGIGTVDGSWSTPWITPEAVVGLSPGVTGLGVGGFHTCVLTSGGGVKCWGKNYLDNLALDLLTISRLPELLFGFP